MKKMNKKGFTLIELLAVIIILGVLLLIAVPSVSKYIQQSRMKTYNNNLSNFVSAVTNEVNAMDYSSPYSFKSDEVLVVAFNKIDIERGSNEKSPFSYYDQTKSFVLVTRKYDVTTNDKGTEDVSDDEKVYTPVGYNYYVQALDESGYGAKLAKAGETTIDAVTGLVEIPEADGTWTIPSIVENLPDTVTKVRVIK